MPRSDKAPLTQPNYKIWLKSIPEGYVIAFEGSVESATSFNYLVVQKLPKSLTLQLGFTRMLSSWKWGSLDSKSWLTIEMTEHNYA